MHWLRVSWRDAPRFGEQRAHAPEGLYLVVKTVLIFGINPNEPEAQLSALDSLGQLVSPARHCFQVLDAPLELG
jgi:hypothetical protein